MSGFLSFLVIMIAMVSLIRKLKQNTVQGQENEKQSSGQVQNRGGAAKQQTAAARTKGTKESQSASAEGSVTEYLRQKAELDQIEHHKEKQIEDARLQKFYGCGCPPAERYIIGDPVPDGKYIVYCPYCRAENLVKFGEAGRKACYFCREALHG